LPLASKIGRAEGAREGRGRGGGSASERSIERNHVCAKELISARGERE